MKHIVLVAAVTVILLAACRKAPDADAGKADVAVSATTTAPVLQTPPPPPIEAGKPVPVIAHADPLSVLRNDDPALAANKRLLFDMWRTVLNAGHQEVADKFIAEDYIQHSPFQRSGRAAMMKTFSVIARRDEIPEVMRPAPVTFVAEGDLVVLVAVDSLPEKEGGGKYTTTHFNMFRVKNGLLSEHWHPDDSPPCPGLPSAAEGGPQPVTGATGTAQFALLTASSPQLANNKRLVFDVSRQLVEAGHEEVADMYLADDIVEHNPNIATGRAGVKAWYASREHKPIEPTLRAPLVAMVAEGNLVVQIVKVELPDPFRKGAIYTTTWFDMYRIADGRIVEHWDAAIKPGTRVEEMGAACKPAA